MIWLRLDFVCQLTRFNVIPVEGIVSKQTCSVCGWGAEASVRSSHLINNSNDWKNTLHFNFGRFSQNTNSSVLCSWKCKKTFRFRQSCLVLIVASALSRMRCKIETFLKRQQSWLRMRLTLCSMYTPEKLDRVVVSGQRCAVPSLRRTEDNWRVIVGKRKENFWSISNQWKRFEMRWLLNGFSM